MRSYRSARTTTPALIGAAVTSAAVVGAALLAGCGTAPASAPQAGSTPSAQQTKPAAPSARTSSSPSPTPPANAGCGAGPAQSAADYPAPGALTGVQFVSRSRGWVVGTRQILATTNAGASWHVQDSGKLNLVSADFIGNAVGWAVGADTVLATTDGGQRWTALPEPCPVIRSVHFVSAQVGFAIAGGINLHPLTLAPASGGSLLTSTDGGHSWRRLPSPPNPQSVCFTDSRDGWLGAGGGLYRTTDGGSTWTRAVAAPGRRVAGYPFTMIVQCAGPSSAWALDIGTGGVASQQPHIGYHAGPTGARPIFAEQYFPHPGVSVNTFSPGSDSGTLSAISASQAVYIDFCAACSYGTAPWALATASGAILKREGAVGGITEAYGASFMTPATGWVVGVLMKFHANGTTRSYPRIMYTQDAGRHWQVQYSSG